MQPIVANIVVWSVCLSVICLSVTNLQSAKMAEPIEILWWAKGSTY